MESPMRPQDYPGRFPTPSQIVPPSQLPGMTPGRDYNLVTHRPGDPAAAGSIRNNGLMSGQGLATQPGASPSRVAEYNESKNDPQFGYDPKLTYFRPVDANRYPVQNGDAVVALRPGNTGVFNQNYRDEGRKADYLASQQTPAAYNQQANNPVTPTSPGGTPYVPEVGVKADRIPPTMFVPHNQIPPEYRA